MNTKQRRHGARCILDYCFHMVTEFFSQKFSFQAQDEHKEMMNEEASLEDSFGGVMGL